MHGKDSVANALKTQLEAAGKKVVIMHFADYLKFGCKEYLHWNGQKDAFGRSLLQQAGTEGIRHVRPEFWVDTVAVWIDGALHKKYDVFIIPDARFPNEIDHLIDYDFSIDAYVMSVRVTRLDFESPLSEEQQQHASEVSLDNFEFDYYINCGSGVGKLEKATESLTERVLMYLSTST